MCNPGYKLSALWWWYKITKGHMVCLFLPNCTEYIILVQAVLLTGATATTCNPGYKPGKYLPGLLLPCVTVVTNWVSVYQDYCYHV